LRNQLTSSSVAKV